MTSTTITNFRQNVFEYIRSAIEYNDIIDVSTRDGNAVVMSREDYEALMETLRLLSTPGMVERFEEAKATPIGECEDFEW